LLGIGGGFDSVRALLPAFFLVTVADRSFCVIGMGWYKHGVVRVFFLLEFTLMIRHFLRLIVWIAAYARMVSGIGRISM